MLDGPSFPRQNEYCTNSARTKYHNMSLVSRRVPVVRVGGRPVLDRRPGGDAVVGVAVGAVLDADALRLGGPPRGGLGDARRVVPFALQRIILSVRDPAVADRREGGRRGDGGGRQHHSEVVRAHHDCFITHHFLLHYFMKESLSNLVKILDNISLRKFTFFCCVVSETRPRFATREK